MINHFNKLLNYTDAVYWKSIAFFSGFTMSIIMHFKNIEHGKNLKFYGLTKFKRSSSGHIKIGDACTFRSWSTSNLIGINRPCIMISLAHESKLEIGDNCGFSGTVIGCFKDIIIGNHVKCGANTLITDSDWHPEDPRSAEPKAIHIHDNVWLGVNVTVLKGVSIGKNSVIGAGSVVTRDIPANVIAAGNPCKVIKKLDNANKDSF